MAATPRVLHVGNFLSGKRASRQFIEELADRLQAAGWTLYRTSSFRTRLLRLSAMVGTVLWRGRQCDLVHVAVFSGPAFIWTVAALGAARLLGTPVVLSLHGGNLPTFSTRWPRAVRWVLRAADAVVAPSTYLRDAFVHLRPDIHILPNPVTLTAYPFTLRRVAVPRLVWMRAYASLYNPELALRVVRLLVDRFPDVQMEMTGPDSGDGTLERCRQLAASLGIADRVRIGTGIPKAEVGHWLARGDVLLNTPNVDNTPTSLVEALACGLCVVSTAVGGIPHLVRDGDDALLVPPDDPAAMAAAVTRVLADSTLAARLSSSGRRTAEGRDWSSVLPEWQRLFASCAARPRPANAVAGSDS